MMVMFAHRFGFVIVCFVATASRCLLALSLSLSLRGCHKLSATTSNDDKAPLQTAPSPPDPPIRATLGKNELQFDINVCPLNNTCD